MKRIFVLFIMCLLTLVTTNAQNNKDSVVHITRSSHAMYDIVNGKYVYNNTMHLNTHICKTYTKSQEIGTIGVDSVYMVANKWGYKRCDSHGCFPKEVFNSYVADKPQIEEYTDMKYPFTSSQYLRLGGEYQRMSGIYRGVGLGFCGGAILALGVNALIDKDNMEGGIATACVLGVGGLICEVLSINYQIKSGMMLQASAFKLKLNF